MRIHSLQNLVSPSHNSLLVLESVGQDLGRAQVGWCTVFHVVLVRLIHTFTVTWQISSGPDSPGRCQSYVCWLSGLPRFSSVCSLHPGSWGIFSCTEHLLSVRTEAQGPWRPNLRPVRHNFCHIILVKASPHLLMGRSVRIFNNLKSSHLLLQRGRGKSLSPKPQSSCTERTLGRKLARGCRRG